LFRGLVKNHGLVDGNKRMGVTATGVFLQVNGYQLRFTPAELRDYALEVAGHHGNYSVRKIEAWLRARTRLYGPRELAVVRRRLQDIYDQTGDPVVLLLEHDRDHPGV
jgi:prophage maintenance system killer protein